MQDPLDRFRFGFAGAFSASVRARDSAFPPHPLFSTRFRKAFTSLVADLASATQRPELVQEWELLSADAQRLTEAAGSPPPPKSRDEIVARFTAFAYRTYPEYPKFIDGLGRQSGKLADVATRRAKAREEAAGSAERIGGVVRGLLGVSMGSFVAGALRQGAQDLRHEASRRLRSSSIDRLDFDEELLAQLPVADCDEGSLYVSCPACSRRQSFPYDRAGMPTPCPECAAVIAVPIPSVGTILARRKSAELRAEGKGSCLGCRAPFPVSGPVLNAYAIAGFCGRKCFELHGKRFYLPPRFLLMDEDFQAVCRCGAVVLFQREDLESVRACESCGASLVLPGEPDLMRAADRACPSCGNAMPISAKLCKECSRRAGS